jgi:hypothetical protein
VRIYKRQSMTTRITWTRLINGKRFLFNATQRNGRTEMVVVDVWDTKIKAYRIVKRMRFFG